MALYHDALALLLERRDAEREVPASRSVVLDTGSKLAILQHVAWRLSLAGARYLAATRSINRSTLSEHDVGPGS